VIVAISATGTIRRAYTHSEFTARGNPRVHYSRPPGSAITSASTWESVKRPTGLGRCGSPIAERCEDHPLVRRLEPPTRIVDALHRGDHATLVDALNAARPGDRILIRPLKFRHRADQASSR